jgi:methylase of polypeptide subunit release factors
MTAESWALISLGKTLRSRGYSFVAVTPATHRRVLSRPQAGTDLRSIFGWNRPFAKEAIEDRLFDLVAEAGVLAEDRSLYRSKVRFATIGDLLFAHSGFPTSEQDAVFFGPDTYRFVRLLETALADFVPRRPLRLIDIGSGSGAGGLCAARLLGGEVELILADINRKALAYSAVNAAINDQRATLVESDILAGLAGEADLIIANPPYLVDEDRRLYRHGGGDLGISLALRIVEQGLARLAAGGRLVVYTGTPIIAGEDPFFQSLRPLLQPHGGQFVYEELDPDVFGEELDRQAYMHADRIAVVGLTVTKR